MNIHSVSLNQKMGYFTFKFSIDSTNYSFSIKHSDIQGMGLLQNLRTKETSVIKINDEYIDVLLKIVDEYLEYQKRLVDSDSELDFVISKKALKKDINQQKKYYYSIIKSNKSGSAYHRLKK